MRLKDKVAIVVGAGQQPGETVGNGRATAMRFAQEGATVLIVDNNQSWAEETLRLIADDGHAGRHTVVTADVTKEADCKNIIDTCMKLHGRIDILHNNVGRSRGDRNTADMDSDMFDEIMTLNLKSMFMTCKHALPVMRKQGAGSIINISSVASLASGQTLTYKTSKGAVNTFTQHIAIENAKYGIRANAILPGLMDTPMAIERRHRERNVAREVVRAERDAMVPLLGKMGTAWDVANAALFLASDEARHITGVLLPVDGGILVKRG